MNEFYKYLERKKRLRLVFVPQNEQQEKKRDTTAGDK